jgi:hypothetical protein
VLGAWYLLTMLQHAFFGPLKESRHAEPSLTDINLREVLALGPLAVLCLWIGVRPEPLLELIRPDVEALASLYPKDEGPRPESPWSAVWNDVGGTSPESPPSVNRVVPQMDGHERSQQSPPSVIIAGAPMSNSDRLRRSLRDRN